MAFNWPLRVYYEDTDAGGVVYHSQYLNFLERARTEWLRSLGIEQQPLMEQSGIRFLVAEMSIRFLAPARLDDKLSIRVELDACKRVSLTLNQTIRRDGESRPLIEATVRIASVGENFRPARIPEDLLRRMTINGES
ncbi:MAG: tol-pal system-associated acyl-CoA thioesterase [Magnetococcales bacterium]|nr:tol-pal system-associated acyl-CoA thioesterase [Magnetococcales bacterium]